MAHRVLGNSEQVDDAWASAQEPKLAHNEFDGLLDDDKPLFPDEIDQVSCTATTSVTFGYWIEPVRR